MGSVNFHAPQHIRRRLQGHKIESDMHGDFRNSSVLFRPCTIRLNAHSCVFLGRHGSGSRNRLFTYTWNRLQYRILSHKSGAKNIFIGIIWNVRSFRRFIACELMLLQPTLNSQSRQFFFMRLFPLQRQQRQIFMFFTLRTLLHF
jgi:hypothetical protein